MKPYGKVSKKNWESNGHPENTERTQRTFGGFRVVNRLSVRQPKRRHCHSVNSTGVVDSHLWNCYCCLSSVSTSISRTEVIRVKSRSFKKKQKKKKLHVFLVDPFLRVNGSTEIASKWPYSILLCWVHDQLIRNFSVEPLFGVGLHSTISFLFVFDVGVGVVGVGVVRGRERNRRTYKGRLSMMGTLEYWPFKIHWRKTLNERKLCLETSSNSNLLIDRLSLQKEDFFLPVIIWSVPIFRYKKIHLKILWDF